MDLDEVAGSAFEWVRKCSCGKRFYQPNSFTNHINSCIKYKQSIGSTLQQAKQRYKARTAQPKKGKAALDSWFEEEDLYVDRSLPRSGLSQNADSRDEAGPSTVPPIVAPLNDPPELDPLQLGRGHRVRKPIQRFKDFTATSTIPFQIPSIPAQSLEDASEVLPRQTDVSEHDGRPLVQFGPETEPVSRRRTVLDDGSWRETPRNPFGLYKRYWSTEVFPHDPDYFTSDEDVQDVITKNSISAAEADLAKELYPFPNLNSFRLGEWYWSDNNGRSQESFRELIKIITSDDFNADDIRGVNWEDVNQRLASSEYDERVKTPLDWMGDGTSWQTATVHLDVPFNSTTLHPGSHIFEVPDFRYRPLMPIIIERLRDASRGEQFHIVPTDLRWRPQGETGPDLRIYGELYNSSAFMNAYKEVQNLPPEPTDDSLPRCIVALMFASDETMLTSFGNAKLWPVYMLFGNESKYRRAKPSLKLFEEVAYFQSLPDDFQDWFLRISGKPNVGEVIFTHLNRELFQAQWRILLDDDFVHAYDHGVVVECFDGVRRRFYPRVLTYSADYPERTSVVSIRINGDHPCPRCLIADTDIHNMGSAADRTIRTLQRRIDDGERKGKVAEARKIIFTECLNVNTKRVEAILKPTSLVPTTNAFSERLSSSGLDVYSIVAVDILHEVEIGVWKSLFIHLLRLLEATDSSKVNTLDARFREVPGFGRDTIRRFSNNVSALKQYAARNYEDLLQCAIPVFEGLFPERHDNGVLDLLFTFAHWHSLAKLRLHTDDTLATLDSLTSTLGDECRKFSAETCDTIDAHELQREYRSRKRAEARKKKNAKNRPTLNQRPVGNTAPAAVAARARQDPPSSSPASDNIGRKSKTLNLDTPKFHSLGDVATYIRMFGTTDSYSTQLSEHFHRFPKSQYRRTNKKRSAYQISRIQTRQKRLRKLRNQLTPNQEEGSLDAEGVSRLPYFIGKSQNKPLQLSHFLLVNSGDLAAKVRLVTCARGNDQTHCEVKDFLVKLKGHILPRVIERLLEEARLTPDDYPTALPILEGLARQGNLTDHHLSRMYFHGERIYQHAIVQINHTAYDCRRNQDTLNPSTSRRDLMCFQEESPFAASITMGSTGQPNAGAPEPKRFCYARLLGIYHVNVIYLGPGALDHKQRRFDFLWVRWYRPRKQGLPESEIWSSRRPETVSLVPVADRMSCGFVDPSSVVRAAHIIPRFSLGKRYASANDKSTRLFSNCAHDKEDWNEYYVNPFADRDMTMRFCWGKGVGHAYSHQTPVTHVSSMASAGRLSPSSGCLRTEEPMDIDDEPPKQPRPISASAGLAGSATEELTDSDDSTYDHRHGKRR